jgi:hypothetical protein
MTVGQCGFIEKVSENGYRDPLRTFCRSRMRLAGNRDTGNYPPVVCIVSLGRRSNSRIRSKAPRRDPVDRQRLPNRYSFFARISALESTA